MTRRYMVMVLTVAWLMAMGSGAQAKRLCWSGRFCGPVTDGKYAEWKRFQEEGGTGVDMTAVDRANDEADLEACKAKGMGFESSGVMGRRGTCVGPYMDLSKM